MSQGAVGASVGRRLGMRYPGKRETHGDMETLRV